VSFPLERMRAAGSELSTILMLESAQRIETFLKTGQVTQ